jgi:hypothetical protein
MHWPHPALVETTVTERTDWGASVAAVQFAPIVIVVALVILIIVRRFAGAPVGARSAILPIALVVIGLLQLKVVDLTPTGIGLIAAEVAIGAAAGAARGYTIRLYERDGHLWQKYTVLTLAVWLGLIAVRAGFAFGAHALGLVSSASGAALVTVGASFVVESLVVARRAAATGVAIMPRGGAFPTTTGTAGTTTSTAGTTTSTAGTTTSTASTSTSTNPVQQQD